MFDLAYWWPFLLIVASNVFYHNIAKWTPSALNPFLGLCATYLVSLVICVAIYLASGSSFKQDWQTVNWASYAWGIVLVCVEVGYIFLYRVGWEVSLAPLLINVTGALILIGIGLSFYHEIVTLKQGLGILLCFIGLYLIK